MAQVETLQNNISFNLAGPMGSGDTTLTPPSYVGLPASGQFRLVTQDNGEIIVVTDASIHPWPILRGQENGHAAAAHIAGTALVLQMTAGAALNLMPPALKLWLAVNFT